MQPNNALGAARSLCVWFVMQGTKCVIFALCPFGLESAQLIHDLGQFREQVSRYHAAAAIGLLFSR